MNDKVPRVRKRPHKTDPRQLAELYAAHYPWVDAGIMEVTHRLTAVTSTRLAAYTNRLASLDWERATGRYSVLRFLYFEPDHCMTQRELAEQMNVTSANITRLIDALETRGLVSRHPTNGNRKAILVRLTTTGEQACDTLVPEVARFSSEALSCFSADELTQLNDLLKRLQINLESLEFGGPSAPHAYAGD
jgi:DNA-binding MarR family transcriptional regulator